MTANSRKQKSLRRIEKAAGRMMDRRTLNSMSQITIRDLDQIAEWLEAPKLCWICRCPKDRHRNKAGACACEACDHFASYPDGECQPAPFD